MKPSRVVPLKLSYADEITTIKREVFDELNIKWKGTEVELPKVVLHIVGFDVLLGLECIVQEKVGLDAER